MSLPLADYIPQTTKTQRPLWFWLLTLVIAFSFPCLIITAPLAAANNHPHVAFAIYHAFGTFCHQLPERSFFIAGHQFAVCARCTGLYAGFALMLLAYPLIRPLRSVVVPSPKWLFLAATPLAVDFSLTFLGIWENTHTTRVLTGLLLGGATVFYVVPGLMELSTRARRDKSGRSVVPTFTLAPPETIAAAPSDYSSPERRIKV
jgi:uncharacterized membrane protein